MNLISRSKGNILVCAFEMIVGILLLVDPVGFTSKIIAGVGAVLLLFGLWNVIKYFREIPEVAARNSRLANGLLYLLIGAFCTMKAEWIILKFPVLTVLYGVFSLLIGICKVQWAADMLRAKLKYWYAPAIGAAITLVFAVLILINPFTSTQFLWIFIAITLIVEAAIDIFTAIVGRKKMDEPETRKIERKASDIQ